jgi:hypothetical protein
MVYKIKRTIQICINHRNVDFVMYVDEFHYWPGEPMRGPSLSDPGEPGCGPEIEIISGSLELDALQGDRIALDIKKQFMESDRLFWILVEEHQDYIEQTLMESEECYEDEDPYFEGWRDEE